MKILNFFLIGVMPKQGERFDQILKCRNVIIERIVNATYGAHRLQSRARWMDNVDAGNCAVRSGRAVGFFVYMWQPVYSCSFVPPHRLGLRVTFVLMALGSYWLTDGECSFCGSVGWLARQVGETMISSSTIAAFIGSELDFASRHLTHVLRFLRITQVYFGCRESFAEVIS